MIPSNKEVHCCDCGLRAEIDPSHFCPPGWEYLQITGRVRCASCRRDLEHVNEAAPMQRQDFQDTAFAPLAPQVEPLGEIEPTPAPAPAPFSAGGGGDFAGGGAEASFEVAAAPAPADPPASSSYSSDSSSSSSDSGSSGASSD